MLTEYIYLLYIILAMKVKVPRNRPEGPGG
jgi:hypothetical protein